MCLLQYWIIKLFLWTKFIFFDRCNLVCLSCYIIHEKIHKDISVFYTCYNMKNRFFENTYSTFRYFILVTIWKIDFFIFHIAHFGILYLLQYEKSIFSMSRFFCPLHSMVYFYFIVAKIWKKNLSNVPSCNSITMILLYLLQYYFLYFIVVSKRNKQLQVDTIANIELPLN